MVLVCFIVAALSVIFVQVYSQVQIMNQWSILESGKVKSQGNSDFFKYINESTNKKTLMNKIIHAFSAPMFWKFTVQSFFLLFIPMLISSSILLFWENIKNGKYNK